MSKENKLVPANQTILIEKAINFLNFRAEKDEKFFSRVTGSNYRLNKDNFKQTIIEMEKGICSGVSTVKARCELITRYQKENKSTLTIHDNNWFKRIRQLLAKWSAETDKDYNDEQRNDILLFIEQIYFAQNYLSSTQDFEHVISQVLLDKMELPGFKSIGQVFGFYSTDELVKILNSILKKDRLIFIGSHDHVGLLFINDQGNIEFFDINHDKDDLTHKDLCSVINYFSSTFPYLRADALLPLRLYALTTNLFDNDFPSINDIEKLCKNGEIAYSPKLAGYLGGINSIYFSNQEYRKYFLEKISEKIDLDTACMIGAAAMGVNDEIEKTLQWLRENNIDLDFKKTDHLQQNILMHSIIFKNFSFTKFLLTKNLELNVQDTFGWTALMYAAVRDNVEILTQLLSAGCDPFIKDNSDKSVINHIQETKNSTMMDALISHQFPGGKNILMEAVIKNDIQSISELLTDIDVNSVDQKGRTALFYAAAAGQEEIVKMLLSAGAVISIQDKSSKTAREYAKKNDHRSVVSLIDTWPIKKTVTTSPPEDSKSPNIGKTPLMIASRNNEISDIKKLLESKVEVDAEFTKPTSPSSSPRDKNRHVGIFNKTSSRSQSMTTESSTKEPVT